MRRGEVSGRAEVVFHQPWIRERLGLLDKSNFTVRYLGTIIDEIRYGTGSPPTYLDESENTVPFVRATDIKDGEVNLETLLHVAAEQPGRMNKCRLTGGELIIVRSGANTGDCAVVPDLLADSLAAYDLILTFQSDISTKFVAAFLDTKIGRLQLNLVKGRSAQPHINAAEVAALQIPLPPITEQQNLVDAIDTARAERKAKLAEADGLLAGIDGFLLDALGIAAPVEDGRRVFAVRLSDVPERFDTSFHHPRLGKLATRLGAAPIATCLLDHILQSISSGATPRRSDSSQYTDLGVKFLRILNIYGGEIIGKDLKYITDAVHNGEFARSQLAANDVLMTITGRVGSAAVVRVTVQSRGETSN